MTTPRQHIINAIRLHGCGYIDRDTVSAHCPICDGVMVVRFHGRLVDFDCCDTGCTEQNIVQLLFDHDENKAVAEHRARLAGLLAAACSPPAELKEAA